MRPRRALPHPDQRWTPVWVRTERSGASNGSSACVYAPASLRLTSSLHYESRVVVESSASAPNRMLQDAAPPRGQARLRGIGLRARRARDPIGDPGRDLLENPTLVAHRSSYAV